MVKKNKRRKIIRGKFTSPVDRIFAIFIDQVAGNYPAAIALNERVKHVVDGLLD